MWKLIFVVCLFVHCTLSARIKSTHTPVALNPNSVSYDNARNSIFYIDTAIDSQEPCLFRYDIRRKKTYSANIKGPSLGTPGFCVPNKGGKTYTCGFPLFVGIIDWDGKSDCATFVRELYRGGPGLVPDLGPNERIYDGSRDPTGNALYVGTGDYGACAAPANQSVHVKRRGAQPVRVLRGLTLPVGYGFFKGCGYILDACQLKIWAIPDPDSKCENSKCDEPYVFIDFKKDGKSTKDFAPAALEVDPRGIMFFVNYYSGCIYVINIRTRKYRKVAKLPVEGPTSLTFGDDDGKGEYLYVSVASRIRDLNVYNEKYRKSDPASCLYRIEGLGSGLDTKSYKP